jgi:hypothetical protein
MKRVALLQAGLTCVCFAASALGQSAAHAQAEFPNRPIRIVVPFAAGGPVDVLGRAAAQQMSATFGQNVLLDNRPGASGILGMEVVARAAPDGHVMLLTSGNFTALPAFTRTLPYDPVRDFAPISSIARIPGFLLAVHPSLPVRSVKDLVALARANPAKLNYGSSGTGGVQHLAMALFNLATDTKMTHVLYKGAPPLSIDLMSGQIETAFVVPAGALEFVRTGRMRAIGFSGKKRWNRLPEVPTIEEAGVKGYEYFTWYGFWYPAAVAADTIGRVHAEIAKTVSSPEVSRRFDDLGFEGFVSDKPADFARFVQDDLAAMKKLATQIGAVPE